MAKDLDGDIILSIKPWVLFRLVFFQKGRLPQSAGIHVRNLEDESNYEFRGRDACLWLLLNGVRNIEHAVHGCQKICSVKSARFPERAHQFLMGLVEANLVVVSLAPQEDKRSYDMQLFLRQLKTGPPKAFLNHMILESKIKSRRTDRPLKQSVRKQFTPFLKTQMRLKIERRATFPSVKKFHKFLSVISWPATKMAPSFGGGASFSAELAAITATGEAIERACFYTEREPEVRSTSYVELLDAGKLALDPHSFRMFAPDQKLIKNQEATSLTRYSKTNWRSLESATTSGEEILVPDEACGVRFLRGKINKIYNLTTNGIALHPEQNMAKLSAAFELIERDNVLFYWRTRNQPAQIDLSEPGERIGLLLKRLGGFKKRVKFFYLRSELRAVTVQAVFFGNRSHGEPAFVQAAATRLNVDDALEKALAELLFLLSHRNFQERCPVSYGNYFDNSIWDVKDRAKLYGFRRLPDAYKFLTSGSVRTIRPPEIPGTEMDDPGACLNTLIKNLKQHRLRLYFQDLTTPEVKSAGGWVYQAYSPDLIPLDFEHRFRPLGFWRYYELPVTLKLKVRPRSSNDLSPWPQPYI